MRVTRDYQIVRSDGEVEHFTAFALEIQDDGRAVFRGYHLVDQVWDTTKVLAGDEYSEIRQLPTTLPFPVPVPSREFEEGLADWEKDLLATDERARKAAEGIDTAVVTAVFTLTNGTTVTREFKLDSIDGPILSDLHADLDIEDVTKPGDVATVYASGERRSVVIHIRGRGFAPGCGPAEPVSDTDYLLSNPANADRLTASIGRLEGAAEPVPAKEVTA